MFPSVREQSTHRHLRDLFNNWDRLVDTSYFVFGILSSSNLPNYATHSYDYGFFIQRRDGFVNFLYMLLFLLLLLLIFLH